jgi:hypothetical protein
LGVQRNTFSSPVLQQNLQNCGHLALFSEECRGFLCGSDCVAEREGFEPSVRFCQAKPRRVRRLQSAKHCQRISRQNLTQNFAISPVSIRPPFASLKANAKRFCGRKRYFARLRDNWGSHMTACLAGSHKIEISISERSASRKGSNFLR